MGQAPKHNPKKKAARGLLSMGLALLFELNTHFYKLAHLGDLGTQGSVLVWALQEVHHLLQLNLGSVAALLRSASIYRLASQKLLAVQEVLQIDLAPLQPCGLKAQYSDGAPHNNAVSSCWTKPVSCTRGDSRQSLSLIWEQPTSRKVASLLSNKGMPQTGTYLLAAPTSKLKLYLFTS